MFKKKFFLGLAAIGMSAAIAIGGTFAWFTSSPTISGNNFTTGTLSVKLTGNSQDGKTLEVAKDCRILPGDVTKPVSITIDNAGTADLAYFGKLVFSGNDKMKDYLYVDSMRMEFLYPDGASKWLPDDLFIKDGVGYAADASQVSEKKFYDSLINATTGKISLRNLMGNNGMNAFGYENMGSLKPGYKYRLTFTLGFSGLADNSLQNQTVNLSYKVISTQVNKDALNALLKDAGTRHYDWLSQNLVNEK